SSRRRHTRCLSDWSSDVCSSDLIEARGLRKTFGDTVALDGVDLRVDEGRILGLIGPNGAGKTTALNAILGLTSYEGELKVLGQEIGRASCRERVEIGVVEGA